VEKYVEKKYEIFLKNILTNGNIRYKFTAADTIFCVLIHIHIQYIAIFHSFYF
jgi:hypothetical protein